MLLASFDVGIIPQPDDEWAPELAGLLRSAAD